MAHKLASSKHTISLAWYRWQSQPRHCIRPTAASLSTPGKVGIIIPFHRGAEQSLKRLSSLALGHPARRAAKHLWRLRTQVTSDLKAQHVSRFLWKVTVLKGNTHMEQQGERIPWQPVSQFYSLFTLRKATVYCPHGSWSGARRGTSHTGSQPASSG